MESGVGANSWRGQALPLQNGVGGGEKGFAMLKGGDKNSFGVVLSRVHEVLAMQVVSMGGGGGAVLPCLEGVPNKF